MAIKDYSTAEATEGTHSCYLHFIYGLGAKPQILSSVASPRRKT